jgi:hypothetical protein
VAPDVVSEVERLLACSPAPLTVRELAVGLGVEADEIAEVVWNAPERFSWQPGGRWTLAVAKATVLPSVERDQDDARRALLSPQDGVELRAITLSSGTVLRVIRRPLDSAALFSVVAVGADLELILNSAHEAFEHLPLPFEQAAGDFRHLVELLLTAWAAFEGECPAPARRGLEDARLLWGRKVAELIGTES